LGHTKKSELRVALPSTSAVVRAFRPEPYGKT
jgi:hypothetical protein